MLNQVTEALKKVLKEIKKLFHCQREKGNRIYSSQWSLEKIEKVVLGTPINGEFK